MPNTSQICTASCAVRNKGDYEVCKIKRNSGNLAYALTELRLDLKVTDGKVNMCLSIEITGSYTSMGGILDFTDGSTKQILNGTLITTTSSALRTYQFSQLIMANKEMHT